MFFHLSFLWNWSGAIPAGLLVLGYSIIPEHQITYCTSSTRTRYDIKRATLWGSNSESPTTQAKFAIILFSILVNNIVKLKDRQITSTYWKRFYIYIWSYGIRMIKFELIVVSNRRSFFNFISIFFLRNTQSIFWYFIYFRPICYRSIWIVYSERISIWPSRMRKFNFPRECNISCAVIRYCRWPWWRRYIERNTLRLNLGTKNKKYHQSHHH